jgi:hypothetical protein
MLKNKELDQKVRKIDSNLKKDYLTAEKERCFTKEKQSKKKKK